MYRFYVTEDHIHEDHVIITGPDVNHMKNVLRMKQGEEILISNGQGKDCYCIINKISEKEIDAKILYTKASVTELPSKITLFQGLPKKDKMELIIQKAVELGVYEIVPVMMARSIVKIEDKAKELKKLERWQSIAESAAKQSQRGIIPRVLPLLSFQDAVKKAAQMELAVIPYENAKGVGLTKEILSNLKQYSTIAVMIGPEGGYEDTEVELAKTSHIIPISLGKRILRTETAGAAVLSMMMLELEE